MLEAVSANGNNERRRAEERRGDIRFFIFAVLFYIFSLVALWAAPLLATPLMTRVAERSYRRLVEEKYDGLPHRSEQEQRAPREDAAQRQQDSLALRENNEEEDEGPTTED